MRTWYPVSIPAFYNPVTSLLKPVGEKDTWSGMRTTGQLRLAHGIKLKPNKDSLYKVQGVCVCVCVCVSVCLSVCV
jgi:ribosome biogenesis protein BMS1